MFNPKSSFDLNPTLPSMSGLPSQIQTQSWGAPAAQQQDENVDNEETENSRRPPNAFILYTQAMRSTVRQDNPSLSNTECSRLLGKMWKEVPNEVKLQYKTKAQALQEEFKRTHPDYTYRKARRKRALNELLTKSNQGYNAMNGGYLGINSWQTLMQTNPGMMPSMMSNSQPQPMGYSGSGGLSGLNYPLNPNSFSMNIPPPDSFGNTGGTNNNTLFSLGSMGGFGPK